MSAGLLAFLIASSASLLLTVPVRALAIRVGMVDLPGPRKVHLKPIPLLGGLAIYGGVMLSILIVFDGVARAQVIGIVSGATLVTIVGFLDDRGWLHHQIKLFAGMPLGATIFYTTLVTISRARRGLLPFATPGKDHSAHRLANLGLGQRGAVLTIYLVGAISGGAALLVTYLSNAAAGLVGIAVLLAMLLAIAWLERAPYEKQSRKESA